MSQRRDRASGLLDATGLGAVLRRAGTWRGLLTLTYHRVVPRQSLLDPGVWSGPPELFEAQLDELGRLAEVVPPGEAGEVLRGRRRGRHVLITFDDGYRDNLDHAAPALVRRGMQAAFFVATGFVDRPRVAWWDDIAWMTAAAERAAVPAGPWGPPIESPGNDRAVLREALLAAYKRRAGTAGESFLAALEEALRTGRAPASLATTTWMGWDDVRRLRDLGMTIGGHTIEHPVLATLPVEAQREEIEGGLRRLEQELGTAPSMFAYPVGQRDSFGPETKRLVSEAGVEWAFSYYGRWARPGHGDPYDVPRVSADVSTSPAVLRGLLALPQGFGRW